MKNKKQTDAHWTRIPLVRGATVHPIIELELEYEDDFREDNAKAKAAQSKTRKKKPARRRKS
jgi:hypothetical protein